MKIHAERQGDTVELSKCQQGDVIETLAEKVAKIDKTLFFGNGVPAVMVQLATINQMMRALGWLVGGTCMAVIGQIVFLVFRTIAK